MEEKSVLPVLYDEQYHLVGSTYTYIYLHESNNYIKIEYIYIYT